jgi:hypothetical protein
VGEVLTASDTNTYLNNGGLVYVTSTTVGSGVSSVTVSNCFSSTYDNYRVIVSGGVGSQRAGLYFQLGASTTTYYQQLSYALYSSGAYANVTNNGGTGYWQYAGTMNTSSLAMVIDLLNPNLAKYTYFSGPFMQDDAAGMVSGIHQTNTAYTGFIVGAMAGTLSGGTITVYGYRKA